MVVGASAVRHCIAFGGCQLHALLVIASAVRLRLVDVNCLNVLLWNWLWWSQGHVVFVGALERGIRVRIVWWVSAAFVVASAVWSCLCRGQLLLLQQYADVQQGAYAFCDVRCMSSCSVCTKHLPTVLPYVQQQAAQMVLWCWPNLQLNSRHR